MQRDADGTKWVDSDAADATWDSLADRSKQVRHESPDPAAAPPTGDPTDFAASRALREYYQAHLAKLALEEKNGKLVDAEDVKRAAFDTARIVRESMLNIPDRIAAQLASEGDSHKVYCILRDEITKALEALAVGLGAAPR